jgi:hypothetical protein
MGLVGTTCNIGDIPNASHTDPRALARCQLRQRGQQLPQRPTAM